MNELENLTFQPKILSNQNRDPNVRYEDILIAKGLRTKMNKQMMIIEDDKKRMSEYTFKPKISKKSEQMVLNKSKSNEGNLTYSKSSLGAQSKCDSLYNDAKQRKENLKQLEIKY